MALAVGCLADNPAWTATQVAQSESESGSGGPMPSASSSGSSTGEATTVVEPSATGTSGAPPPGTTSVGEDTTGGVEDTGPVSTGDTGSMPAECDADELGFESSCYFYDPSGATWISGREFCFARGSDLVVIESAEENEFIASAIEGLTWIGLTDVDVDGEWVWVTGVDVNFDNWALGQPLLSPLANCARTEPDGVWGAEGCDTVAKHVLCERGI